MKYVVIPESTPRKGVPFYFAVEEYVARTFTDDDYFFIWQVDPCVMLGRNQLINNEINIENCHKDGVAICRRKSGGGCIYSDAGCLLFSYIVSDHDVARVFEQQMRMTARAVELAGVNVELSGRNDLLVEGRKVAGAAFYRMGRRSIMHNSLLYCTDFEKMQRYLTPSHAKLESKGVASVSQRVGNVGDYTQMEIPQFITVARQQICGADCRKLTEEDLRQIAEIEQRLASEEFIYGSNPKYSLQRRTHLEGVGTLEASVEVKSDRIAALNVTGDYFLMGDIDTEVIDRLRGVRFERQAVSEALQDVRIGDVVRGLTTEGFLRLLFGAVRKPSWLKMQSVGGKDYFETENIIREHGLHTICQSGRCPNRAECWKNRTATFLTHGDICTRACRFCNTLTGRPKPLDSEEPARVAESIRLMGLKYAVITSVDRDDLPDLGAAHWASIIEAVRHINPDTRIELLIPDFQGKTELMDIVLAAKPDVVGHNMETIRRLTPSVRSGARYDRSLSVLKYVSDHDVPAKTGFMLGLGEEPEEILQLMSDIYATGCRRLTIGQYLQPTHRHLPVEKYYTPEEFHQLRSEALNMGFKHVESGPLVRSSYHAAKAEQHPLQQQA